ncbi:MAG: PepSY domain-containing protein [Gemmatimonadaceae bacterium]|nr:PepSY domain-containing protein [Gemmatimonadaceae bacterium]
MITIKSLRLWHRWVSWVAAIFILWAAATGVLVAFTEFFGAEETERERLRDVVSDVRLNASDTTTAAVLTRALRTAEASASGAPVDKVELKLKGDPPTVSVFLGKPTGGEDKLLRIHALTGALLATEDYADKPFLYRLHSGEAFGDGGLVVAMLWGLALVAMTMTGGLMYLHMYRKHQTAQQPSGLRKFFW